MTCSRRSPQHLSTALLLTLLVCQIGFGEEKSLGVRYRRVEIPASHLERFAEGLLPRPREEFRRLVQTRISPSNDFSTAKYVASITGNVINGSCKMRKNSDAPSDTDYLMLGGRLPILRPSWISPDGLRPAVLGNSHGTTLVISDSESNTLHFDWNLRGQLSDRSVTFELSAPNALIHEMRLTLPEDRTLRSDRGVVTRGARVGSDTIGWTLRWSGSELIRISMQAAKDEAPELDVHQESTYRFQGKGFRVTSTFDLSRGERDRWPTAVAVAIDSGISIIGATCEGNPVRWLLGGSSDGSLLLELPENIEGTTAKLRVDAVIDFPLSKLTHLPRIRHAARWRSESIQLVTQRPFAVNDVDFTMSRCRSVEQDANGSEVMQLELESPDAEVDVRLDRVAVETNIEALVTVAISENSVVADVEMRFLPIDHELFELDVEIATESGWLPPVADTIDAFADTTPLNQRTSVLDRYKLTNDHAVVRLKRGATQNHPVDLSFQVRNESFTGKQSLHDLVPFKLPIHSNLDVWVLARDAPDLQLVTTDSQHADWQLDDAENVPLWVREQLLATSHRSVPITNDLFVHHSVRSELVGLVRQPKPALTRIETLTNINIGPAETRYMLTIQVDPLGKEVSKLGLAFSHPVSEAKWSYVGRAEAPSVQRESPRPSDSATWDRYAISFEPTTDPFELRFNCQLSSLDRVVAPLVSIAGASTDGGTVVVTADGPVKLDIVADKELGAIPFAAIDTRYLGENQQEARIRACYVYNDVGAEIPQLHIDRERLSPKDALSSWRTDVRSFYSEKGRPRHRIDFYLQSDGANQLLLKFPSGNTLDNVEVDGQKLPSQPRVTNGLLSIPLPEGKEFPCVTVRYVGAEQSLGAIDWLRPPIPSADLPTLHTTWQAWLPSDYRSYDSAAESNVSWLQRLFGTFATRSGPRLVETIRRNLRRRLVPGADSFSINLAQFESLLGPDRFSSSSRQPNTTPTWGGRIRELEQSMSQTNPEFKLLIDREELRRMGIFPESPLPRTRYSRWRKMGTDRLVQAGLAVIIVDSRVILTSSTEAKQLARGAELVDGVAVEGQPDWLMSTRVQSAFDWHEQRIGELWRPSPDALEIGLQRGGWLVHRNVTSSESQLKIYHRDTAIAVSCSMFLIGYAMGWWLLKRNARRWFTVAAIGFLLAATLPQPAATFAIAFAWGTALGGITRRVSYHGGPFGKTLPMLTHRAKTAASVAMIACLFFTVDLAEGAQPNGNETGSESLVYFPVDEEGHVMDVVYMPQNLYRMLKLRELSREREPEAILRRALYSGDWPTERSATRLDLTVEYEVTTLARDTRLQLSGFDSQVSHLRSLIIDGKPTDLVSGADGEQPTIVIERPGDHRIRFQLAAPLASIREEHMLRLPILPIPHATLRLNVPREVEQISVPTALGGTHVGTGVLTTDLGPTDELHVRAHLYKDEQDHTNRVDQLLLLYVSEDETILETRFQFDASPQPLTLRVDSRLEPLNDSGLSLDWNAESRELKTGPINERSVVRFRMSQPTTVGRLSVPEVSPIDSDVATRRLAVVTSGIDASIDSPDIQTFLEEEFVRNWPTLDVEPTLFLEAKDGMPTLRLTQPTHPETWTAEASYFFDILETRFEAVVQLTPSDTAPSFLSFRKLKAPQSMHIRSVVATSAAGVPLRIRWHRNADTLLLFFLTRPELSANTPVDIVFTGEIKTKEGPDELPLIIPNAPTNGTTVSQSVVLYRSSDVVLDVDNLATVDLSIDRELESERTGFRFVGSWMGELSPAALDSALTFAVDKRPAQRTLTGKLTTTLHHRDEGWGADITAEIMSSDGIVDAVHFEVPASIAMIKPTAFEGETELRVDDVTNGPGLERRIVTVWLPAGVADKDTARVIKLSTRLTQDQTQLPDVRLLNVSLENREGHPQQFIELPLRSGAAGDSSRFSWTPNGLAAIPRSSASEGHQRYRVTQPFYSAELIEIESETRPEVHLLETTVGWASSSEYLAMAQYDIKPSNQIDVVVELPMQASVLQVMCDDAPSFYEPVRGQPTDDEPQRLRVRLVSSPWPQRLRIVFRGTAQLASARRVTFYAPRLFAQGNDGGTAPIPVLKELWRIFSSDQHGRGVPVEVGQQQLDEALYDDALIASFRELWNSSQVVLREKPRGEKLAWLYPWAQRYRSVFDRSRQVNSWNDDPELQTMNQLLADYPEVFDPDYFGLSNESPTLVQPEDLWNESQWSSGNELRCASATSDNNDLPAVQVLYPHSSRSSSTQRYYASLILAIGAVLLPRWSPGWRILARVGDYLHVLAIAIGLAWWAALSPSWLGLALAAVVAIAWIVRTLRAGNLLRR